MRPDEEMQLNLIIQTCSKRAALTSGISGIQKPSTIFFAANVSITWGVWIEAYQNARRNTCRAAEPPAKVL